MYRQSDLFPHKGDFGAGDLDPVVHLLAAACSHAALRLALKGFTDACEHKDCNQPKTMAVSPYTAIAVNLITRVQTATFRHMGHETDDYCIYSNANRRVTHVSSVR
jgi:hypothetical protein